MLKKKVSLKQFFFYNIECFKIFVFLMLIYFLVFFTYSICEINLSNCNHKKNMKSFEQFDGETSWVLQSLSDDE